MDNNGRSGSGDDHKNDRRIIEAPPLLVTELLQERRKYERYFTEGTTYAAIGPDFRHLGHVVNISRSGLAFSYIDHPDILPDLDNKIIQLRDNHRIFCDLPFISISDTIEEKIDAYSSVDTRIHRGRFGRLSREQKSILLSFLKMRTAFSKENG